MASSVRGAITVVALGLLAWSPVAMAQNVETGGKESLTVKGFISATFFAQNQPFTFGNGQPAEFPNPPELKKDRWLLSGDVRNTRMTLVFNGPETDNGLKLGGAIEADFFGGFNGTGAFSDEQPNPRLRLAYVDVHRGRTTFRLGQAWSPLFGNVPVSLSHIAFPLGYGSAGDIGWRFPGFYVYHDIGKADAKIKTKFTLGLMRGSWSGPGNNLNSESAGETNATPQVEARVDWSGKTKNGSWGIYIAGHWDEKDLSGQGTTAPNDSLTGTAGEIGAKIKAGSFSIQGNFYNATAIGQQFAHITQFGDITSTGAWVQLGFDFNANWAGYLFYGFENPNDSDVIAAGGSRLKNEMTAVSVQYSISQYAFSVEWLRDTLTSASAGKQVDTTGDQISTNVIYHF